jgi:GDPmannose 4,6-dehydratase
MNINKRKALICGVSGQDGTYLADLLLKKGYQVFGGSRDAQASSFENLKRLHLLEKIDILSINLHDFRSVFQTIKKIKPDEIYNLPGQSSVALSFEQPVETMESISTGTLNILEAIRFSEEKIRFYNAGSSECFGNVTTPVNEMTPFRPRSPYAVAKSTAYWYVSNYREAYNMFACTGILFNHESPLRKERFVTKKIITTAFKISSGIDIKLNLGNINIQRDWGWAPEYVNAMWLMLQLENPDDFIIATGKTTSLEEFINITFKSLGLNWKDHVIFDNELIRPTDINLGLANPNKAKNILNWEAKIGVEEVIRLMLDAEKELNE